MAVQRGSRNTLFILTVVQGDLGVGVVSSGTKEVLGASLVVSCGPILFLFF